MRMDKKKATPEVRRRGKPSEFGIGKKQWRPSRSNPAYTDFVIRVLMDEADLIQTATEAEAERLSTPSSRNNYCVRAIVAAAKKELARTKS